MSDNDKHKQWMEVSLKNQELEAKMQRLDTKLQELKIIKTDLENANKKQTENYNDVLDHMKRDVESTKEQLRDALLTKSNLETEVEEKSNKINQLEAEKSESSTNISKANQSLDELSSLEKHVKDLKTQVNEQASSLQIAESRSISLQEEVSRAKRERDDLRLELHRTTSQVHVENFTWTLKHSRHRITGRAGDSDIPMERDRNSLTAVSKSVLLLFGGTTSNRLTCTNDLYQLRTGDFTWERVEAGGEIPCVRGGHADLLISQGVQIGGSTMKKQRLLIYGGRRNPLLKDLYMLNADTMKWTNLETPHDLQEDHPPSLEKASLVQIVGNRVLLMGGDERSTYRKEASRTTTGALLDVAHGGSHMLHSRSSQEDVQRYAYILDLNNMTWSKLECHGQVPNYCNMSLTASACGKTVYAFGGSHVMTGDQSSALHVVHVDNNSSKLEWSVPDMVMGNVPAVREGHAAAMVGRYLFISGGWNVTNKRLGDTHVLDTERMCWECLMDASTSSAGSSSNNQETNKDTANNLPNDGDNSNTKNDTHPRLKFVSISVDSSQQKGTRSVTVCMLGCSPGSSQSQLDEAHVTDIQIPEEALEGLFVRDELQISMKQDLPDMKTLHMSWNIPSSFKGRQGKYKIMMSLSGSAMVKEVFSGTETSCRITGIKPGSLCQFRVKAEFSDGSYLWSEVQEILMSQKMSTTTQMGGSLRMSNNNMAPHHVIKSKRFASPTRTRF